MHIVVLMAALLNSAYYGGVMAGDCELTEAMLAGESSNITILDLSYHSPKICSLEEGVLDRFTMLERL